MKSQQPIAISRVFSLLLSFLSVYAVSLKGGEIHDAAAAGDLTKVKALLEADPTLLEAKANVGVTPLMSACSKTQFAVADFLVNSGANVNARNTYGVPVLNNAIQTGDECIPLVQRLIDKGAEINVKDSAGGSPLHVAVNRGNLKVIKLLIDHGADLHAPSRHGTPLQMNILFDGSDQAAIFLVENSAKPREFSFGNTDLHFAAIKGRTDLVQAMAQHRADLNAVNAYGHTPLYYAARHGHRGTAEALINAGADKSAVVETNYGKAPQLTAALKDGEAYLWFLGGLNPGTGYAVKTKEHLLIFDPPVIDESQESGLANGRINPNELAGLKTTVLTTYDQPSQFGTFHLMKRLPRANFVLSAKPTDVSADTDATPSSHLAVPHENFSMDGVQVHAIPSMRRIFYGGDRLSYLVETDGLKIFHAGIHAASNNSASQLEKYRKEIDFLKPFGPIDLVILPISGRHITVAYEPYLYLIDQLSPKAIYLIGDDLVTEEHKKCLEVLKTRNVPVFYPEGGIAIGERFHFLREETSATSEATASAAKSSKEKSK